MSALSPSNDKTYTIADPPLIWSLGPASLTTQVPPCGYSETLSATSSLPAFITAPTIGSSITYLSQTRDIAFANVYQVVVVSTLNNYNFSPAKTAPSC
jgi:hypothetical protein